MLRSGFCMSVPGDGWRACAKAIPNIPFQASWARQICLCLASTVASNTSAGCHHT